MAELEKVIKGLEICIRVKDNEKCPDECPYRKDICYGTVGLMADALSLLKAQEPIEPRYIDGKRNHFIICGNCNTDLIRGMKYCSYCGKAVKWDE